MKTVRFASYKVASSLPLDKIAAYLKTQMTFRWNEYIILNSNQLDIILKYHTEGKSVYLFKYGCISFVNFMDNEVYDFLKHFELITGKINYNLFYKFHESHIIEIDDNLRCRLWKGSSTKINYTDSISHIVSIVLAKSAGMYVFETELTNLFDSAEKFIIFLQKGRLSMYVKKSAVLISKILRFEFDSINSVMILDRPLFTENSIKSKEIYDALADYYELDDRFSVMQSKINDLREMVGHYSSLSHNQSESRLLRFEIFLLALFPLFHIIHHFLDDLSSLKSFLNIF